MYKIVEVITDFHFNEFRGLMLGEYHDDPALYTKILREVGEALPKYGDLIDVIWKLGLHPEGGLEVKEVALYSLSKRAKVKLSPIVQSVLIEYIYDEEEAENYLRNEIEIQQKEAKYDSLTARH